MVLGMEKIIFRCFGFGLIATGMTSELFLNLHYIIVECKLHLIHTHHFENIYLNLKEWSVNVTVSMWVQNKSKILDKRNCFYLRRVKAIFLVLSIYRMQFIKKYASFNKEAHKNYMTSNFYKSRSKS